MSTTQSLLIAGRYRLLRSLGEGGMGRVWLGHDQVLNRDVAIKELVPLPGLTPQERQELQGRSMREARAIARLNHPHVVRVFDVVKVEDGDPWIVMEYVPGRSLADAIHEKGTLPPQQVAAIGLQILGAVRAAHEVGVVHRDIKPGNVLLADDGRAVLTDFGLAAVPGDPYVTRVGLLLGSPAYIAPERARGVQVGEPADLWSLGATLYHAVEGHAPFARDTAMETLTALVTDPVPFPRRAGPLTAVLTGLLQKDPAQRLDAPTVAWMLEAVTRPQPSAAPTRTLPTHPLPPPPAPTVPVATARVRPAARARGTRLIWLLVLLALLVSAAALLVNRPKAEPPRAQAPASTTSTTTAAESPTPARTSAAPPASSPPGFVLPAGWRMRDDGTGFLVPVPENWQFGRDSDGRALWQDRPTGRLLLIDQSRHPKPDPLRDWQNNEQARRGTYPDYQRIRLERVSYWDSAADWEFTYTLNNVKVHVLNRNFITAPDQAYSIYWRTPESSWQDNLDDLHTVLNGFVPARR